MYLYLTTTGWKSGKDHEIEIWFTELEGRFYVIAEKYDQAHWVQNLRRDPRVRVRVGKRRFEGRARVLNEAKDGELVNRVRELSDEKYGWSAGLVVELRGY